MLDKTLIVKDGANASIDLNGHNLSLNENMVVDTENATVSAPEGVELKTGSVIEVTGEGTKLTVDDKGDGSGTISGGYIQPKHSERFGVGIFLNMERAHQAGDQAVLTMNGGTISNNTASGTDAYDKVGGGIGAILYPESDSDYEAIVINDATITGNKAQVSGAGMYVSNGKVSITDSVISDNIAEAILESVHISGFVI